MFHHARLMSTLKALEILAWLFTCNPVASSTAEIDSNVVDGSVTEMHPFCARFTEHLANTFVGDWVESAIEGSLVDHGHESTVSQQSQGLPTHIVQRSSRLVVIHAHAALDGNLIRNAGSRCPIEFGI